MRSTLALGGTPPVMCYGGCWMESWKTSVPRWDEPAKIFRERQFILFTSQVQYKLLHTHFTSVIHKTPRPYTVVALWHTETLHIHCLFLFQKCACSCPWLLHLVGCRVCPEHKMSCSVHLENIVAATVCGISLTIVTGDSFHCSPIIQLSIHENSFSQNIQHDVAWLLLYIMFWSQFWRLKCAQWKWTKYLIRGLVQVVVLWVGTNNIEHTAEQVAGGILAIAQLLTTRLPKAKIVVLVSS